MASAKMTKEVTLTLSEREAQILAVTLEDCVNFWGSCEEVGDIFDALNEVVSIDYEIVESTFDEDTERFNVVTSDDEEEEEG